MASGDKKQSVTRSRSDSTFFGLFSVVGKDRPNHPLRFRKPIYTYNNGNGTITLYYKASK